LKVQGILGWLDVTERLYVWRIARLWISNSRTIIANRREIRRYLNIAPFVLGQIVLAVGLICIHLGELLG
jgi:hypothetical protein